VPDQSNDSPSIEKGRGFSKHFLVAIEDKENL